MGCEDKEETNIIHPLACFALTDVSMSSSATT